MRTRVSAREDMDAVFGEAKYERKKAHDESDRSSVPVRRRWFAVGLMISRGGQSAARQALLAKEQMRAPQRSVR